MAKKTVRSQAKIDNVVAQVNAINPQTRVDTFVKPVQNTKGMQVAKALRETAPAFAQAAAAREKSIIDEQIRTIAGIQARIEADGGGYLEHESWDNLRTRPRMMIAEYFGNKAADAKILEHKNYLSRNKQILLKEKGEGGIEEYIANATMKVTATDDFGLTEQAATKAKLDEYFNQVRNEGITEREAENKRNSLDAFSYAAQDILSIETTERLKAEGKPYGWEALENWFQGFIANGTALTPAEYKIALYPELLKGVKNGTITSDSLDYDRIPTQWKSKEIKTFIDILKDEADKSIIQNEAKEAALAKQRVRENTIAIITASNDGTLNPDDYREDANGTPTPQLFDFATNLSKVNAGVTKSLITGKVAERKMMAAFLTDKPELIGQKDLSFESVAAYIQSNNLQGQDAQRLINLVEKFEKEPLKFSDFHGYQKLEGRIKILQENEKAFFTVVPSHAMTELDELATVEIEDRIIDYIEENESINNTVVREIANDIYNEYKAKVDDYTQNMSPATGGNTEERIADLEAKIKAERRPVVKQRLINRLNELKKDVPSTADPFASTNPFQ
jgi:hypothetical protein